MADGGVVVIKFKADSTDIDKTLKNIKSAGKALNNDTKALNAQTKQYEAVTKRILAEKKGIVTEDKLMNAKAKLLNAQTNAIKTNLRQSKDYLKAQNTYFHKINVNAKGLKASLAGSLKSLLAMASVGAIVGLAKQMLELSSDLTEVQNVVETAFPNMTAEIDAWAKNSIEKFGLSEKTIKEYASTLGLMTESMGLTEKQAFTLGTNLAQLTGDLASMYNKDSDDVFTNVKAGIIQGRANSMASLGIVLSEANIQAWLLEKGLNADYSAMSSNEKVIARYNYILEQTTKIQGDFTKTSGTWANQTRILRQNLEKLGAELGEMLVTVLLPLLQTLNKIISMLIEATKYLKEFLANTFGIKWQKAESSSSGISDGLDEIADSADEANKAMSKLTNGPFSELHKLAGDTKGAGSSIAESLGLGSYDVNFTDEKQNNKFADFIEKIKKKIEELLDRFKWIKEILDYIYRIIILPIITRFQLLWKLLQDIAHTIFDPFIENWEKIKEVAGKVYEAMKPVFDAVAEFVEGACQDLLNFYDEHIHPMFEAIESFLSTLMSEGLDKINEKMPQIQEHLQNVSDWINDTLKPAFDEVLGYLGDIFDDLKQLFEYMEQQVPSLILLLGGLATLFLDVIGPAVTWVVNNIIDTFSNAVEVIRGIVGLIIDVITGNFENLGVDLYYILDGVISELWDLIGNFVTNLGQTFQNVVNTIIDGINMITSLDLGHLNFMDSVTSALDKFKSSSSDIILKGVAGTDFQRDDKNRVTKHANGGFFQPNQPHLAILGDNTSENEYALTESHLKQIAMMMNGGNNGGNGGQTIIYIGNEQIQDFVVKTVENNNYRNGGM